MKPEMILQSDVLDILFENRNKTYGAYTLRRNYNNRLLQALGGTSLLVFAFFVLRNINNQNMESVAPLPPETKLTTVIIPSDPVPEKPKEPAKAASQKQVKAVAYTAPAIKPDVAATTVPTTDNTDKSRIGKVPGDGEDDDGKIPGPPAKGPVTTVTVIPPPPFDSVSIRHTVDIMPSFNGDLKKFMLKNLRQPDDLEEGQRIVVRIRFVVTRDGEVSDVEVIQMGRNDLDQEVIRVVKKMPRWNPGMQSGRKVPVYFNLPVSFVSGGE